WSAPPRPRPPVWTRRWRPSWHSPPSTSSDRRRACANQKPAGPNQLVLSRTCGYFLCDCGSRVEFRCAAEVRGGVGIERGVQVRDLRDLHHLFAEGLGAADALEVPREVLAEADQVAVVL